MYDELTGKCGIYFPCNGETVYVYHNDKDLRSYLVTVLQLSSHYMVDITYLLALHQTLVHTSILSVSGSIIQYQHTYPCLNFGILYILIALYD